MKGKIEYNLILLLLFAASCKSSKETSPIALPSMTVQERISSIIQSEIQYNDLSSNLKLTIRPDKTRKEISVDAQLRIVRNEAIQISLRIPFLGSEAFRILVTPDRLLIVDRLNKQYLSETIQNIQAQTSFDFDFYSWEALLTNRLFIAGEKEINLTDYAGFRVREENFRAHVIYPDNRKILYEFESDYTHRIQNIRMEQKNGYSYLHCNYSDWESTSNNRIFPMTLNLQLNTPSGIFDVNFSYKSVAINTTFAINYDIPDNYRQITLQQALQLFKQLL